ncbi:MAG: TetR/AcrR family transcriptional regulator [Lactobacillales bacterium]|jgi:AcrR family transcriptional regulator|nr:TetR/AcrR family transcriptional regulator [Lactobacillales bacterium]
MLDKKERIFEAGRRLFLEQEYKTVNVAAITQKAGVATGTFYNYYPSKEELFIEIFNKENQKAKKRIIESLDVEGTPIELMKSFLAQNKEIMRDTPILKEWHQEEISEKIRKYYQEGTEETHYFVRDVFTQYLHKWRQEKKIRTDIDDEVILSVFDALVYLENHQEETGIPHFEQMIEVLAGFFISGLEQ